MSIWHLSRMVSLLRRLFKRNSAGQETIEKTTRREPEKQIGSEHNSRPKSIVPSSENDQSTITANDNMFSQRKRNVFARMYGKLKAQKRLKVYCSIQFVILFSIQIFFSHSSIKFV